MNLDKIKSQFADTPKFRMKQVWKGIFVDFVNNWNEITTLPKELREKLNKECPLEIQSELSGSKNSDSRKALITLEDGARIETVLLKHNDGRRTVCVSSQVGCAMGCRFCATGTMGRERSLTTSEIVEQVLFFARHLKSAGDEHKRVTNVVFMGMGEPFLNYDNVMEAIRVLNDKEGLNIGARHISVSTSGIVDGIKKFTKEPLQLNLAISLHAPNDELRSSLMPVNRWFSLDTLLRAVKEYTETNSRQVMFEYLMIGGVNDKEEHARELAPLMKNHLYVVNLIRYNPTGVFQPSTPDAIRKFKNILLRSGVKVTQRQTFGQDIDAACGQLAIKKMLK